MLQDVLRKRLRLAQFQHDANLLFGGKLAANDTFDVPHKLLCFLSPSFNLPDIYYSLGHDPAPFHPFLYFFLRTGVAY